MSARRRARRVQDLALAVSLALLIAAVFGVSYGRTNSAAWTTPIAYRGDGLFLAAYLKAASDGHVYPGASLVVPELNAPFGANWNDHPRTLRAVFALAGLAARRELFLTLNLLLLFAHVLAGIALFAVARCCGARREWAFAAGLAFGLSHFLFWRTLDHLDLALVWHVPLCILVVSWAFGRRGLRFRSGRFLAASAITVCAALHNPYYASLYAQFLLLAALAQGLRGGRSRAALAALALVGILIGTFLLDNAGSLAYSWRNGRNPAAARPYGNLERFAIKPLELVVAPPGFGLGNWGGCLAGVHWAQRLYRGEGGSSYLGLVGAAGLLALATLTLLTTLRHPPRAAPPAAAAIVWILAYSVVGGANQAAGLLGFAWLRGTNRFSVWILALVLLFLATRAKVRRRWLRLAIATLVCLLCLADQVPRRGDAAAIARTRYAVALDRRFVGELEAALPPGSQLFMLPVTDFPEGQPLPYVDEYAHLRPYLHARTLRFSFGSDKGRPREAWQRAVARQSPERLARSLEVCGFGGILLNRRAYPSAAADWLAALAEAGRPVTLEDGAGDYAFVRLAPLATRPSAAEEVFAGAPCRDALAAPPEDRLISDSGTRRAGTGPG